MARGLNFRHVEVIYAVVLTGTATGAAARLNVTQPAISNIIKDAEDRLGFSLFMRHAGRIVPTQRAEYLFAEIERSFTGLDAVNEFCKTLGTLQARKIRIAATPAWATSVLPKVISDYRRIYASIGFSIITRSSEYVQSMVYSYKVDLGFGLSVAPVPGVVQEKLISPRLRCLVPLGHRLAQRSRIHAQDLLNEPLITFSEIEGTDSLIAEAFENYGGMPRSVVDCPSALTVCAMVEAGVGIALSHPFSSMVFRHAPIVNLPFVPAIKLNMYAYWSAASQPDFDRDTLIDLSRKHSREIQGFYSGDRRR